MRHKDKSLRCICPGSRATVSYCCILSASTPLFCLAVPGELSSSRQDKSLNMYRKSRPVDHMCWPFLYITSVAGTKAPTHIIIWDHVSKGMGSNIGCHIIRMQIGCMAFRYHNRSDGCNVQLSCIARYWLHRTSPRCLWIMWWNT